MNDPQVFYLLLGKCRTSSPGNEVILDHWKGTKMLTKVFQRNLTWWGYVKPHPNPPWEKPRFSGKIKNGRH